MAKRKNHPIVGVVRAMLDDQSLPLFIWVEACSTFDFVQNRIFHRSLGFKTPKEMFMRKNPKIGHFRIFGCLTCSHVPSEKRTKLDTTGERGYFVGYDETSKDFHIYLPA